MNLRILIVDDDSMARRICARAIRPLGAQIDQAASGQAALALLDSAPFGLVLSDYQMPGLDGAELLAEIRLRNANLPVIIMTSHASIDLAVELMRQGASDFITKPVDAGILLPRIQHALEQASLNRELKELRARLAIVGEPAEQIVGASSAIQTLRQRLPLAARSEASVLIQGETGTGKELVARALHQLSPRREQSLITLNAGALPEPLLESELFGHVRGAFTDAKRDKKGLVEMADGGTLFLDEVGDLPPALQVKLLRFLQEGELRPVGGNITRKVDVRIVAATHKDLKSLILEGKFREDLYYRLNVVPLRVPPLRERLGDLPLLAEHLLSRYRHSTSRPELRLSQAALERLSLHSWPGNVRELENVLQRALVFSLGDIEAEAIEFDFIKKQEQPQESLIDLEIPLRVAKQALVARFERCYIETALRASGGNLSRAARRSGKDRKSFWELCQRYGIEPSAHRS